MKDDTASIIAMAMFALGAVVVILYQHASATNSVLAAVGAAAPAPSGTAQTAVAGKPASLAGTVTPGQSSTSQAPAVVPLAIGPGYTLQ